MIVQGLSLIGALLVLLPYTLLQFNRLAPASVPYQAMNVLGAGLLTGVGIVERQYGFILLEGVWAAVSLMGLVKAVRGLARS